MSAPKPPGGKGDKGGGPLFASDRVPLYYQLATILREKITIGEYGLGARLPTEAQLVSLYGVSRITVRQALANLAKEGLIQRAAGKGTFVTGRPEFTGTLQMDGSMNGLISMGLSTTVKLLNVREVEVQPGETGLWGLKAGSRLVRAERLRYYKDKPYCYIVNRVPWGIGRRISRKAWSSGSILKFIRDDLQIELGDADAQVRATLADVTFARWLEIRIGAPVLLVEYSIRSGDGTLLERPSLYYRSDLHSFNLQLRKQERKNGETPWTLQES